AEVAEQLHVVLVVGAGERVERRRGSGDQAGQLLAVGEQIGGLQRVRVDEQVGRVHAILRAKVDEVGRGAQHEVLGDAGVVVVGQAAVRVGMQQVRGEAELEVI